MVNRKDWYFAVFTVIFLFSLGYTGWQNLTGAPQACGGLLIDSVQCRTFVSNTLFFTILELLAYLIISVLIWFGSKK